MKHNTLQWNTHNTHTHIIAIVLLDARHANKSWTPGRPPRQGRVRGRDAN